MITSSNGNIFRVNGPLWEESNGNQWIPLTKVSDAELWSFLWPTPEKTVQQAIETPVIWDTTVPIMMIFSQNDIIPWDRLEIYVVVDITQSPDGIDH